ncbi:MAG: Nramp family divalent metal transporter, partial [Planctomycetes bacterium]|nr:Nramp family divalent metal transporter [Planctomycetota bacterium]
MTERIPPAPRGLAVLAVVGPSFIWCAEYIGSGEVILATRTGALLGTSVLWAIILAILLKCCIGMAGAHWTALTGEGMIDLFDRIPGPRHWLVWLVLAVQLPAGIVSIGAIAKVAGVFLDAVAPLPHGRILWGLAASIFAVGVAWSGRFDVLKMVMSALVAIIVLGVLYVALQVMPPWADVGRGLLGLEPRVIPDWATAQIGRPISAWHEIVPLMGWSAGGFASQVWYGYWVLGAGYGMAAGRGWGQPADAAALAGLTPEAGNRLRDWCRIVRMDATVAAVIGITVTTGFCLAGAGVLRPAELVPQGNAVALTLSNIFSAHWGRIGGYLFLIAGSAAMVSTLVGILSGWPRLLSDCVRIVWPAFGRLPVQRRLRIFLVVFVVTNAAAVFL